MKLFVVNQRKKGNRGVHNKIGMTLMKNIATEYVFSLYESGLMNEYSEEHLLIKAMNGQFNFFDKYPHLKDQSIFANQDMEVALTFLVNFSLKLQYVSHLFGEQDLNRFIKDQLSAGKNNYSEEQFIRAASEINVLKYVSTFCGKVKQALYEPKLGKGNTNPEARLEFDNEIIFDIEVKTPGFANKLSISKDKNILLKPNVVLTTESRDKLKMYCDERKIDLIWPDIMKLKDFITSAANKFEAVTDKKHFNLLFINWTYTGFPEWKLNEPLYLLTNPISGILYNKKARELIGLNEDTMDKISAIVLYQDTFDTLTMQDFRHVLESNSYMLLLNERMRGVNDFKLLCKLLSMKPYDHGFVVEWYPAEYAIREDFSETTAQDACRFVLELLFSSEELLSSITSDEDLQSIFKKSASIFFVKK